VGATLATAAPAQPESASARTVRERAQSIARRSIESLRTHNDVAESDVAQFLYGCYGCGNLIEVAGIERGAPESCDVCGALSPELARFGPFYSVTTEHLGQRRPYEILAILADVPDGVSAAVAGMDDETLRRREAPDEWCVKEIVGHLLETEMLFTQRVNTILDHDGPGWANIATPVPPWKLHEGKGYIDVPIEDIVARLRATRTATLALVGRLTSRQWARKGSNVEGATTVLDLGTWLANHDLGHMVQVRRLCGRSDAPPQ
jgi:hypothetical protein